MSNFWERLDGLTEGEYSRKRLALDVGIAVNTISMWSVRKNYPTADVATRVARALCTTVEYLVEGESGADYIRSVVTREGSLFRPPDRIAPIVDALNGLSDSQLKTVETMVTALVGEAGNERAQGS